MSHLGTVFGLRPTSLSTCLFGCGKNLVETRTSTTSTFGCKMLTASSTEMIEASIHYLVVATCDRIFIRQDQKDAKCPILVAWKAS
jgi:hypothetical protein